MEDKEIYKYTIKDLQTELQKARTTILNIINKLDLKESAEYYKKVKENGRDKTYYSQKLLDTLKEYINNTDNTETKGKEDVKTEKEAESNTSLEKSRINDLIEQIEHLKRQLENKDEQIKELHQIIAIKEQTELAEKKLKLLDNPEQKKEKLSFWQRLFKRKDKEEL